MLAKGRTKAYSVEVNLEEQTVTGQDGKYIHLTSIHTIKKCY